MFRAEVGKFKLLVELFIFDARIGKALMDLDGRWLEVNAELCRILGYGREELLATDFQSITHPEDLEQDLQNVRDLLEGVRGSYQMEKRYQHKDGHLVWVLLNASLVTKEDGQPRAFISQIQDITARKVLEEAMHAVSAELVSLEGADFYHAAALRLAQILDADMAIISSVVDDRSGDVQTIAIAQDGRIAPNARRRLEGAPCREVLSGRPLVIYSGAHERYPASERIRSFAIEGYGGAPLAGVDGRVVGLLSARRGPVQGVRLDASGAS